MEKMGVFNDDTLTEEQVMLRDMVRDFCRKELAPRAAETDLGRFPEEAVKKMAGLGLMGIAVPAEYGGGGVDSVSAALAMEEISAVCPSTSVIFSVQNSLVCDPISEFGSESQKQEYLRPLASGEKMGCFGLTEPSTGSDNVRLSRGD